MKQKPIDLDRILGSLKEFQQRTVDYVFRRLYTDDQPTTRFLVADEVGLGKTMVARGLIARTIDRLRRETGVKRIDIVYICSNAAIAKQNINRLNIFRDAQFQLASRLTMLPVHLKNLSENEVNFVSFTPSTTFELKSRGGQARERALLYFLLKGKLGLDDGPLSRVLRLRVSPKHWRRRLKQWDEKIDSTLRKSFLSDLRENRENRDTVKEIRALCKEFAARGRRKPGDDLHRRCVSLIGALRETLAHACVQALEPDLIILDEFQRFRDLLEVDAPSDAAKLARVLLNYRDEEAMHDARVVMLSATPYRMLTLRSDDEDEDHYADFLHTMRFLLEGSRIASNVWKEICGRCGGASCHLT